MLDDCRRVVIHRQVQMQRQVAAGAKGSAATGDQCIRHINYILPAIPWTALCTCRAFACNLARRPSAVEDSRISIAPKLATARYGGAAAEKQ